MIRIGLNLSEVDWADGVWAYCVINRNSPRMLDVPMAQGLIDFARAGQMSIITPFCLAGALAPVTGAGALVLQHAEASGASPWRRWQSPVRRSAMAGSHPTSI